VIKNEKRILLHLTLIPGIGPATILKLCGQDDHEVGKQKSLSNLYTFTVSDFRCKYSISEKVAHSLVSGLSDTSILEKELEKIDRYKIDLITIFDETYPTLLRHIYLPPPVLYCKGVPLQPDAKRIAIVGARKAGSYTKRVIDLLVPALTYNGWEIISGGARGADSMAHKATLEADGRTIVVFGSGLLHTYPKENKELFRKIVQKGGTLISSFPLQTSPDRGLFPARNRIIAGLSKGCVVIRAGKKSGALITAKFALDQGRQVFAVPGLIDDELSVGCHELIKQGAKVIASAQDIVEEFGETLCQTSTGTRDFGKTDKNGESSDDNLEPTDVEILRALNKASSIDELMFLTGISLAELQSSLFLLQLAGRVRQNFAGMWERV
jgi:DNA processing protein